ncbi:hypothetical protein [Ornithinimicrobium kibberense]|uniref:hypothetical protein n=1 Tax=Ornithinimicrobium kibberense TaxID=282060 RepID=UPI003620D38F
MDPGVAVRTGLHLRDRAAGGQPSDRQGEDARGVSPVPPAARGALLSPHPRVPCGCLPHRHQHRPWGHPDRPGPERCPDPVLVVDPCRGRRVARPARSVHLQFASWRRLRLHRV